MDKAELLHSHYTPHKYFPMKFTKLKKNKTVLRIAAFVKCYLQLFEIFSQTGDDFLNDSEVHFLLMPFSKKVLK